MKRNMMGRNLRRSIRKSFGRYIAIAVIIALGTAIFVGLRSTKSDMVATGQRYTDEQNMFDLRLTMVWYSAIFASAVVAFPLMYRTARGAFESFDVTLAHAARTLGKSNTWIFWRVMMPYCKQGIIAGTVLAFARALGEYGATAMIAGYTPGKTATISTTVYQLWRTGDDAGAMRWVLINLAISAVVLLAVNMLEKKDRRPRRRTAPVTGEVE